MTAEGAAAPSSASVQAVSDGLEAGLGGVGNAPQDPGTGTAAASGSGSVTSISGATVGSAAAPTAAAAGTGPVPGHRGAAAAAAAKPAGSRAAGVSAAGAAAVAAASTVIRKPLAAKALGAGSGGGGLGGSEAAGTSGQKRSAAIAVASMAAAGVPAAKRMVGPGQVAQPRPAGGQVGPAAGAGGAAATVAAAARQAPARPQSGVKPRVNVTGGQAKSNTGIDSFYDNHMSGASGPEISVGLTRTASLPATGSWSGSADEVVAASRKTLFDPADQWQLWSGSLNCSWRTPVNDGVAWAFPLRARALHPHDSVRERVQQLPTQLQAQVVTWAEVGSGRLKDALWSAVDRYHEGPYEAGDRATSVEFSSSRYEASNTERLKQLIEYLKAAGNRGSQALPGYDAVAGKDPKLLAAAPDQGWEGEGTQPRTDPATLQKLKLLRLVLPRQASTAHDGGSGTTRLHHAAAASGAGAEEEGAAGAEDGWPLARLPLFLLARDAHTPFLLLNSTEEFVRVYTQWRPATPTLHQLWTGSVEVRLPAPAVPPPSHAPHPSSPRPSKLVIPMLALGSAAPSSHASGQAGVSLAMSSAWTRLVEAGGWVAALGRAGGLLRLRPVGWGKVEDAWLRLALWCAADWYHFHEPETEAVLLAAQDPDNPDMLSLLADLSRAMNKDVVPAAGTEDSCVCFEWLQEDETAAAPLTSPHPSQLAVHEAWTWPARPRGLEPGPPHVPQPLMRHVKLLQLACTPNPAPHAPGAGAAGGAGAGAAGPHHMYFLARGGSLLLLNTTFRYRAALDRLLARLAWERHNGPALPAPPPLPPYDPDDVASSHAPPPNTPPGTTLMFGKLPLAPTPPMEGSGLASAAAEHLASKAGGKARTVKPRKAVRRHVSFVGRDGELGQGGGRRGKLESTRGEGQLLKDGALPSSPSKSDVPGGLGSRRAPSLVQRMEQLFPQAPPPLSPFDASDLEDWAEGSDEDGQALPPAAGEGGQGPGAGPSTTREGVLQGKGEGVGEGEGEGGGEDMQLRLDQRQLEQQLGGPPGWRVGAGLAGAVQQQHRPGLSVAKQCSLTLVGLAGPLVGQVWAGAVQRAGGAGGEQQQQQQGTLGGGAAAGAAGSESAGGGGGPGASGAAEQVGAVALPAWHHCVPQVLLPVMRQPSCSSPPHAPLQPQASGQDPDPGQGPGLQGEAPQGQRVGKGMGEEGEESDSGAVRNMSLQEALASPAVRAGLRGQKQLLLDLCCNRPTQGMHVLHLLDPASLAKCRAHYPSLTRTGLRLLGEDQLPLLLQQCQLKKAEGCVLLLPDDWIRDQGSGLLEKHALPWRTLLLLPCCPTSMKTFLDKVCSNQTSAEAHQAKLAAEGGQAVRQLAPCVPAPALKHTWLARGVVLVMSAAPWVNCPPVMLAQMVLLLRVLAAGSSAHQRSALGSAKPWPPPLFCVWMRPADQVAVWAHASEATLAVFRLAREVRVLATLPQECQSTASLSPGRRLVRDTDKAARVKWTEARFFVTVLSWDQEPSNTASIPVDKLAPDGPSGTAATAPSPLQNAAENIWSAPGTGVARDAWFDRAAEIEAASVAAQIGHIFHGCVADVVHLLQLLAQQP